MAAHIKGQFFLVPSEDDCKLCHNGAKFAVVFLPATNSNSELVVALCADCASQLGADLSDCVDLF